MPKILQNFFPNFTWRIPVDEKVLFLTFDDGPIPNITPWVMDQLDKYNASATFFCVGANVELYPHIFEELKSRGHLVGNHTYNHISGWTSENIPYYHNVRKCARLVKSNYFRPPYGKIKPKQSQFLSRHYNIVMWDVLSGDFDPSISAEVCYTNVIKNVVPGSIVVFHDSIKSEKKLKLVLPRVLEYFSGKGYVFRQFDQHQQHVLKNSKIPA